MGTHFSGKMLKSSQRSLKSLAFVLLAITASGLVAMQSAPDSLPAAQLRNGLHGPFFALLSILAYLFVQRFSTPRNALFVAALISVSVGFAVELAQILGWGQPSIDDLGMNLLGTCSAILLAAASLDELDYQRWKSTRMALRAAAAALMCIILVPIGQPVYALGCRAMQSPVIASFEHDWELSFYRPQFGAQLEISQLADYWPDNPSNVAAVTLSKERYSGLNIDAITDWTTFNTLNFEIFTDDPDGLFVILRINDRDHNGDHSDRFNKTIKLTSTPMLVTIDISDIASAPLNRNMRLDAMENITLRKPMPLGGERFFVDNIRLSR